MTIKETSNSSSALVLVDFINEIVEQDGKLAGKGYYDFRRSRSADTTVSGLIAKARSHSVKVIHVRVGFSASYVEHPGDSPLFGAAKKFGALTLGGWGTEFASFSTPLPEEKCITKHRVSAFYGTELDLILKCLQVKQIVLAGCATDLAVQSAARDAHDRDYKVVVCEDACIAANMADHDSSISLLRKICTVARCSEIEF